jgi:hypothetical protein
MEVETNAHSSKTYSPHMHLMDEGSMYNDTGSLGEKLVHDANY